MFTILLLSLCALLQFVHLFSHLTLKIKEVETMNNTRVIAALTVDAESKHRIDDHWAAKDNGSSCSYTLNITYP